MNERKSCADLAGDLSQEGIKVSAITVWTLLTKAGFNKTKSTRKPRLTWKMRRRDCSGATIMSIGRWGIGAM
jgi:hypothetical protein